MRKHFVISLCVASVMVLAGCAAIPEASGISVVSQVNVNAPADQVRVIARPPSAAMTPNELVEGFIAATASLTNNYFIARQYLTPPASKNWKTEQSLIIDSSQTSISTRTASEVVLRVVAIGNRDKSGRLYWYDNPQVKTYTVNIVKSETGYRISSSNLPVAFSAKDFLRNYSHFNVYFLNTDFDRLVPDSVWLPITAAASATQVVNALLAGTPTDFRSALRSAIPEGTKLDIAAVTTTQSVANVTLSSNLWRVSKQQRVAMLAQMVWTLTDLNGIAAVSVTAGGQPLLVDAKPNLTRSQFTSFSPDIVGGSLFVAGQKALSQYVESEFVTQGALKDVQSIAVTSDGKRLAFIRANEAFVSSVADVQNSVKVGSNVTSLDFDRNGRLWLLKADGSLAVVPGSSALVSVSGLTSDVIAFATSPDGVRIATIEPRSTGSMIEVHAVATSTAGIAVSAGRRVQLNVTDVLDVDWVSSNELVVVGRSAGLGTQIYRVTFDGLPPRSLGVLTDAAQVFAAPGAPIAVLTRQGALSIYIDGNWKMLGNYQAANYAG